MSNLGELQSKLQRKFNILEYIVSEWLDIPLAVDVERDTDGLGDLDDTQGLWYGKIRGALDALNELI